jgi:hypothetical protein
MLMPAPQVGIWLAHRRILGTGLDLLNASFLLLPVSASINTVSNYFPIIIGGSLVIVLVLVGLVFRSLLIPLRRCMHSRSAAVQNILD